jgi:micrococcal nuclease
VPLIALLAALPLAAQDLPRPPRKDFARQSAHKVARVEEGTVVVLEIDGRDVPLRLLGVTVQPTESWPTVEAASLQSSQGFLDNLLRDESVYVEYPRDGPKQDDDGRKLAFLYRAPDGLWVNLELVRQGYGRVELADGIEHAELLKRYEESARSAGRGYWKGATTARSNSAESGPTASAKGVAPGSVTVYVTKSGKKYHRASCVHLNNSRKPLSLTEARKQGYEPCSQCKPP